MNFDEMLPCVPTSWNNSRVHFFKYMSFSTAKAVLTNGTLRWSTPGTLNDPYDIQFDLAITADRARLKEASLAKLWEVFKGERAVVAGNILGAVVRTMGLRVPDLSRDQFEKEFGEGFEEGFDRMMASLPGINADIRKLMADSKILCLTTDPINTSMWAHYGELNRGAVLRFRSIAALSSPFGMAKPVEYVDHLPKLVDEDFLAEMFAGLASINPSVASHRMVFTKGSDWSYEKEWRIFAGAGRNKTEAPEDLPFHDLELDGLIFGLAVPDEGRQELKALADRYPNVEIMEAVRSSVGFRHEIRTLHRPAG
ncbi:DUF2971 domain-containing protein [Mesorhizobium sp. ESP7-2]|uniref:DUF2971 domain-containing protein n=1 Tax=Mesorhizobium sp. ESP7-2 TaxID=2876622 RepID=UPI001CCDC33D|nr:DUF2971 domain-containing protein [Mesorhizobium sp. ESP7-2]MBZ9705703.1 DUF2971 domain-containing protein [Mesorhizobium sp. ESP7-2]